MRRRMEVLAHLRRSDALLARLAETHLEAARDACGLFYVDGHVRASFGRSRLQKAHLARARIAQAAEEDTWICDAKGDGVFSGARSRAPASLASCDARPRRSGPSLAAVYDRRSPSIVAATRPSSSPS